MAFKRKSTLISWDTSSEDTSNMNVAMSVTTGLGPLSRTAQRLKASASMWDTTTDDMDGEDFSLSIARGLERLCRSKRSKKKSSSSESDYGSPFCLANINCNPVELDVALGPSVNLANQPPSTRPTEGMLMGTGYSEPQLASVTTDPSQNPYHRQHEKYSTPSVAENGPLDPPAPLKGPTTTAPEKTASLTERFLDKKPSEIYKQEGMRLLKLPLDILCLVADHLDVVALSCLRYAHPALGSLSKIEPGSLSLCAKSRIVSFLQRDGVSFPKELLGVARKGTNKGECWEYHTVVPMYCVICRCDGHLSHCPGCQVRTCAREDTEFWRKWTGLVDVNTTFPIGTTHSNPRRKCRPLLE